MDAEIAFRSSFDPIAEVAVGNLVQIHFQYLIFGIATADLGGDDDFGQFALRGRTDLRRVEDHQPGKLLRDGTGPGNGATGQRVLDHRAGDTEHIEARVLEEALIFSRNCGMDQIGRNLANRHLHPSPAAAGVIDLGDGVAAGVHNMHALEGRSGFRWQPGNGAVVLVDHIVIAEEGQTEHDQSRCQRDEEDHDGQQTKVIAKPTALRDQPTWPFAIIGLRMNQRPGGEHTIRRLIINRRAAIVILLQGRVDHRQR